MSKKTAKKVLNVIGSVLLYLFLLLCIFAVVLTVVSKKDSDGASELFGYQIRIVTSDSMASCEYTDVSQYKIKSIPVRSMLFIELVPEEEKAAEKWYSELEVGDVLTFRYVYTTQITITHRIVSITEKADGGYVIELAGDNVSSDSGSLRQTLDTSETNSPNYVIGKVTGQSYPLGFFLSLVKTPIGIILIVIVPCFIIILLEILRIVGILGAEKRKKREEEAAMKDNELEELRRRLAQLEGNDQAKASPDSPSEADGNAEPQTECSIERDQPNIEPTSDDGDGIDTPK